MYIFKKSSANPTTELLFLKLTEDSLNVSSVCTYRTGTAQLNWYHNGLEWPLKWCPSTGFRWQQKCSINLGVLCTIAQSFLFQWPVCFVFCLCVFFFFYFSSSSRLFFVCLCTLCVCTHEIISYQKGTFGFAGFSFALGICLFSCVHLYSFRRG